MRALIIPAFLLLTACFSTAQSGADAAEKLRTPGWNYGLWADYGNGVGTRTDVHFAGAGVRFGRVLTGENGSGWRRGTLEYDIDLTPVEIYHLPSVAAHGNGLNIITPAKTYYTGGFNPFVVKWNFTGGQRWVPYASVEGGIVFSNGDLPQGDTANVNFTSGAAFGLHRFVSSGNAWTFQGKIFHLSNASLGPHNPGINAAVQFKIGYTWFKR